VLIRAVVAAWDRLGTTQPAAIVYESGARCVQGGARLLPATRLWGKPLYRHV